MRFSMRSPVLIILATLVLHLTSGVTKASTFHFMQIEQVIGGVNGDATAQAIQLRMRFAGQRFINGSRLIAYDSGGANPVEIIRFSSNVLNGATGDRVLIVSESFISMTTPPTEPDFIMTNLIPESYLTAGRLTFEDGLGTIYWSLAWGGANYTGSTMGSITNDDDGDFGPPWSDPLPSVADRALQFQGDASAQSTTNAEDYELTAGAAVFTNNARDSFTIGEGGGLALEITGSCPGTVTLAWSGATPGGTVGIVFASNEGAVVVPDGRPCAGTQLGLGTRSIQLVTTAPAGGDGSNTFNGNAPSLACGGFVQLLDLGSCATSNVAQLP